MSLLAGSFLIESGVSGLRVGRNMVALPPALASSAASSRSGKLLVGVRPAQLRLAEPGDADAVPATVYSHESVGRQIELMLTVGDSRLRYRGLLACRAIRTGEKLHIGLSLAGSKLFDAGSGEALL
jgi:ABC-type sugar transport system ATPase subunit